MDPVTMMLIGGGIGLLKGKKEEEEAKKRQIVEMAKARWGALANGAYGTPEHVAMPDVLGSTLGGAFAGYQFGAANPAAPKTGGAPGLEMPSLGDSAMGKNMPAAGGPGPLGAETNLGSAGEGAFTSNKVTGLEHSSDLSMPSLYDGQKALNSQKAAKWRKILSGGY